MGTPSMKVASRHGRCCLSRPGEVRQEDTRLRSVKQMHDSRINATDDQIGHVKEAYFDDDVWTIRYLAVDTGTWLTGRKVLISPYSIRTPLTEGKLIEVTLSRDIDPHKPGSRQHEQDYLDAYERGGYWE